MKLMETSVSKNEFWLSDKGPAGVYLFLYFVLFHLSYLAERLF